MKGSNKKNGKGKIKADAFLRSLDAALAGTFNVDAAVERTGKMISHYPKIRLYHASRKGKVTFYKKTDGQQKYVAKSSDELYALARRQYLVLLNDILRLTGAKDPGSQMRRRQLIESLHSLINIYAAGNLDLAKIVLTAKQYKWYFGNYRKKFFDVEKAKALNPSSIHVSSWGEILRSKSERDIKNVMEDFAVPAHYEEELSFYVRDMVDSLKQELHAEGMLRGNLFHIHKDACYWTVPKELSWMNTPGSAWKSYDPRTGCLTIYNDFRIMLASGEFVIWEHHGNCFDFTYRNNAGERLIVMRFAGCVPRGNLIETFECDADSTKNITDILCSEVLPRLWF